MQPRRCYLDTNVVISLVEDQAGLSAAQRAMAAEIEAGRIFAITSELTLAECLVKPLQLRDERKVAAYTKFLSGMDFLPVMAVGRGVLVAAAQLRADTSMKLPDAIHVATAHYYACEAFVSGDIRIKLPSGMQYIDWTAVV